MVKNSGGKIDEFSTSPEIRQVLLHWRYELKKENVI